MAGYRYDPLLGLKLYKPGTGTGVPSPENFSYTYVASGQTLTIPFGQLMLYRGVLTVDGLIILSGDIVEI